MTQKELATAVNAQPKEVCHSTLVSDGADDRFLILNLEKHYPTSNCWARLRGSSVSSLGELPT
jgi:hypothetical protein